jgi:hypothetical protein
MVRIEIAASNEPVQVIVVEASQACVVEPDPIERQCDGTVCQQNPRALR